MPASYHLRCLGAPQLRGPDGQPIRFRTRKQFGLFIYLAVEPARAHRRDRLAEMFWPRVSEQEARHSLATAVTTFRSKLGPRSVQADRDHLQLSLAGLELDLARLERGDVLGNEFTPPLDIANFLDQFEPPDAAEFLHWRDRQQARLFPAIREGLLKLIDRCRRTGNFRQIEVLADRLLGIDHLSEDGIRAKMEARAFDGDRLSALKIYEVWRETLQAELGAGPSPLVEGIATRLRRRGLERTTSNEIPTVPTDQWKGHRFVARSREYRELYESWERTARRESTSALILGDSGVGKTTLADRLATAAGLEGASAVRAQCYEADREIPYATLSGLVRGLLDRPGAACTRTGALADLATCLGEVRQRFPSLPAVEPLQGEAVRVRLAEATHELVSAVAEEGPVILVVDDVHLADDASIAVIHQLLRRTREQSVMVVLTARPVDLDRSPSARRLRENAASLGVSTIEVPPMTEEESRELLVALVEGAGAVPTLAERRALLTAAGGFPMVLELLVRDWLTDGRDALALTFSAMTTDPSQGSRAEHAYRALIERMIQELPPEVRNVLNLAAILGNRLNDLEMYSLVDLTLARTMTGMTTLADLRLLRDNGKELGFRNELIRAQAYMGLPSTLRRALHSRVADRLIAGQTDRPVTGLELAWHCFRGGRPEEGRDYLISGAREAIDGGAVCEAEMALVTALPRLHDPTKSNAALMLAEALEDQGRWQSALQTLAMITPDAPEEWKVRCQALRTVAEWQLGMLPEREAVAWCRSVALELPRSFTSWSRTLIMRTLSLLLADLHDPQLSRSILSVLQSIEFATVKLEERPAYTLLVGLVSFLSKSTSEFRDASRTLLAESAMLHGQGAGRKALTVFMAAGAVCSSAGQYEQAIVHFSQALRVSTGLGNDSQIARSTSNLAMCYCRLGKYVEAAELASVGLDAAERASDGVWFKLVFYLCWARAMRGERRQTMALLESQLAKPRRAMPAWAKQSHLLQVSDIYRMLGREKDSIEVAILATTGENAILHSNTIAGPYTRALAIVAQIRENEVDTLQKVELMCGEQGWDRIDSAEMTCAQIMLRRRVGLETKPSIEKLAHLLQGLPGPVPETLSRLGFSVALECAASAPEGDVLPEHSL